MWRLLPIAGGVSLPLVVAQSGGGSDLPSWALPLLAGAGTFLGTLLSGKFVVPTFAYTRERDRADKLEAEVTRLHEQNAERWVPALTASTAAVTSAAETVQAAIQAMGKRSV